MTYRFWNIDEAMARHDELRTRVDDERERLSDFRKPEAVYLALTDDERDEFFALQYLVNDFLRQDGMGA